MVYFRMRNIPEISKLNAEEREALLRESKSRLKWRLVMLFGALYLPINLMVTTLQYSVAEQATLISTIVFQVLIGLPVLLILFIPTANSMIRRDLQAHNIFRED